MASNVSSGPSRGKLEHEAYFPFPITPFLIAFSNESTQSRIYNMSARLWILFGCFSSARPPGFLFSPSSFCDCIFFLSIPITSDLRLSSVSFVRNVSSVRIERFFGWVKSPVRLYFLFQVDVEGPNQRFIAVSGEYLKRGRALRFNGGYICRASGPTVKSLWYGIVTDRVNTGFVMGEKDRLRIYIYIYIYL